MDTIDPKVMELAAKVAVLEAVYQNYLSWAALIVAVLTLVMAVSAIVSIAYFRHVAKTTAETAAGEIAERIAELAANSYMQREAPQIIASYNGMLMQNADDCEATRIMEEMDQ